ncbi:hypothetical protein NC652_028594 [Populus alba x Populus x berolinensis]|nr:hypothetical protein NC652_028592 [Populus alba x Populus x berolinensis]KAJ6894900.1 hypothetical protein NC652_028594 [Populus alba x Populus x berolinensis]
MLIVAANVKATVLAWILLTFQVTSGILTVKKNDPVLAIGQSCGVARSGVAQGPVFEAKVAELVELGFGRGAVIQALRLFDGDEEQAAGFLLAVE